MGDNVNTEGYFYGDLPEVLDENVQQRLLEASINGSEEAKRK